VASAQYFLYILRCCDGRLYVGQTSDLAARLAAHNDGKGAAFTAARRPVSLIYFEGYSSRREAMQRELQVKQWSAAKKSALVAGDLEQVHRLSRCRQRRCK
jgi:putative endonuclease